jgi:hypothetical protein
MRNVSSGDTLLMMHSLIALKLYYFAHTDCGLGPYMCLSAREVTGGNVLW